jgi:hypothetical protein
MTNRLKDYFDQPDERPPEEDYFVVAHDCAFFYVTREVAERILVDLQADVPPRWLRFTDVSGSSVCVRTRLIDYVRECTQAQRAAQREFRRARRLEEKADRRPWEEDDD